MLRSAVRVNRIDQLRTLHFYPTRHYTLISISSSQYNMPAGFATQVGPYSCRTRMRPFWSSRPSPPDGRIPARGLSRTQAVPCLGRIAQTWLLRAPKSEARLSHKCGIALTRLPCGSALIGLLQQSMRTRSPANSRVHNVAIPWSPQESYRWFIGLHGFAFLDAFRVSSLFACTSYVPNLAV